MFFRHVICAKLHKIYCKEYCSHPTNTRGAKKCKLFNGCWFPLFSPSLNTRCSLITTPQHYSIALMSAFKDYSAILLFDGSSLLWDILKSQQTLPFKNGCNDYGCIQMKQDLRHCKASHCD